MNTCVLTHRKSINIIDPTIFFVERFLMDGHMITQILRANVIVALRFRKMERFLMDGHMLTQMLRANVIAAFGFRKMVLPR